jgi:hypothetical protein
MGTLPPKLRRTGSASLDWRAGLQAAIGKVEHPTLSFWPPRFGVTFDFVRLPLLTAFVLGFSCWHLTTVAVHAEEIHGLSTGYSLSISKDGSVRLFFSWPERFGRKISTVALNALDLSNARLEPDRGAMEGSLAVTIPTKGNAKAVSVQAWDVRVDGDFPSEPDGTYLSAELVLHCDSEAAAQELLAALREAKP